MFYFTVPAAIPIGTLSTGPQLTGVWLTARVLFALPRGEIGRERKDTYGRVSLSFTLTSYITDGVQILKNSSMHFYRNSTTDE